MDFVTLVATRLEELGENVNSFETRMGWKQGFLRAFLRNDGKRSEPTLEKARLILTALGLELYAGPPRDPEPPPPAAGDFVQVPLHDADLAAGPGAENASEVVVGSLAFRRNWLTGLGVPPSAARLARVSGRSMEPILFHRDIALVNTRERELRPGQRAGSDGRRLPIYALRYEGGTVIKRVQRPRPDQLLLVSDNPDYPPQLIERSYLDQVEIIGRVRWWGHTVRE